MTCRIKICGLSTAATLDAALDAGTDCIGLVFFAKSPRNVSLTEASALAARAHGRARVVALVVDADDATLARIVGEVGPDIFQLHGNESPERAAAIRRRFGCEVWKAVPVATAADAGRAFDYLAAEPSIGILFDAKPPKGAALPGGNGLIFDWRALEAIQGRLPFMLSGGLTPANVAAAIRLTHPALVDVSSGVESAPGIKDPALIRAFIAAARSAADAPA